MDVYKKVKKTISQYNLIKSGDKVIIGVSGGPDSVALLEVLYKLRYEYGLTLIVVHVNHQLRKGANADQLFVEKLCKKKKIPCHSIKIKIDQSAKGSLEEIAREKRFNALIRIAKQKQSDSIALAHHQDDLAETVLMRILRGTGLMGLQGILPKRNIKGYSFIRPLIEIKKSDIITFLNDLQIKSRLDPSNKQKRFFRNKIRLDLLPLLEDQYKSNVKEVLANLANNIAVDYDYLEGKGYDLYNRLISGASSSNIVCLKLSGLKSHHISLVRIVLRLAIRQLKGDMNCMTLKHFLEIEDLINNRPSGSVVDIPSGISVVKDRVSLTFKRKR